MKPAGGLGEPLTSSSRCLSCNVCMQQPCVCIPMYAVHAPFASMWLLQEHGASMQCVLVVAGCAACCFCLTKACEGSCLRVSSMQVPTHWHVTDVQISADCQLCRCGLTVMQFMYKCVVAGCNMCCMAAVQLVLCLEFNDQACIQNACLSILPA